MVDELYILPFDHRNSFLKDIIGVKNRPTKIEIEKAKSLKLMIYDAFKKAIIEGVPKEHAGILTDDWLGIDVLKKVKKDNFIFCIPVEKSGQEEFDFEKSDWKSYIKKWNPNFVKALVRYNPEGDAELNKRQAKKLAELSNFLRSNNLKFMFELLVPPTDLQLKKAKDRNHFDQELRPKLMVKAIKELHNANVFPYVWKIEGLDKFSNMKLVSNQILKGDKNSKIIILGRGESRHHAENWLIKGAKVKAAIGFAIGRTIFQKPLEEFYHESISRDKAIEEIKFNFKHFVSVWNKARK